MQSIPIASVPATDRASLRYRIDRALDSAWIWPALVGATVIFLAVFIGYPVIYNLAMSFQEVNVGNLRSMNRPFVGLANYVKLLDDPLFWDAWVDLGWRCILPNVFQGLAGCVA